jgi:hypothetical protein
LLRQFKPKPRTLKIFTHDELIDCAQSDLTNGGSSVFCEVNLVIFYILVITENKYKYGEEGVHSVEEDYFPIG